MKTRRYVIKAALTAITAAGMLSAASAEAKEYKIDVALDTGPNHIRNISIKKWADVLNAKSNGELKINVFEGASKFKGSAVPTALAQGTLDMGVPGTWQLTKFIPEYGVIFLPMFFGRDRQVTYQVMDGEIGKELVTKTEQKLNVKILGRFIDIGPAITFMKTEAIKSPTDYEGKRIRIAGSAAHARRYEALGANAVKVSWPDVPQALQTGMVDGVMTAFESVRSAKLWDSGIKYAYVDQHAFHQYVPMINMELWNSLPKKLQDLMETTWDEAVGPQREFTADRDSDARTESIQNGITVFDASAKDLDTLRESLYPIQDSVIEELRIDPDFAKRTQAAVEKAAL
ncbi:TRAP transporter substrate-binding protein DctP [Sneathiella chinensis]|uniref:ABC transporter substrate-binding protein n=1 Tax=Sneathiella chinensis TaxID=349750 RepID=A0ABQ5U568_9PROT|nr:TRAP transporter substrate-binding protein DctP [Sneathiella chinensis]GLQ07320.1 ABC transporter substrate-binding protein [Sneathiella chinensis]